MDALKAFIIEYHNEYGYDTTNDWNYSWTFSKALLFTVTIITTIGKILRVSFFCNSAHYQSVTNQHFRLMPFIGLIRLSFYDPLSMAEWR